MRPLTSIWFVAAIAGLALMAVSGPAVAGGLQVTPTKVLLSAKAKTGLLTLSNDGAEDVRIQATAYRWTQSAAGKVVLDSTTAVVVYPSLFTLAAGAERTLRIGVDGDVGKAEASYRVILEELPPSRRAGEASTIRVLTRLSLPVFVRTAKPVTKAEVRDLRVHGGHASFEVANTGTTYFVLNHARIVGRDAAGAVVVDRSADGWYVLVGGAWAVDVDLDADTCAKIAVLDVEATDGTHTWRDSLDRLEEACDR